MEMINRYVHAVGRYLDIKNREDIQAEIRSHLEDTLDERTGGKPTDEDAINLLKEVGAPRKMAASYAPQTQYLVGPELYPLFRMIFKIVLAATLGAQLLAWGVALWSGEGNVSVGEMMLSLLTSVPTCLGWLALVFIILQRAGVKPDLDEDWDPRSLEAVEHEDEIKRGELIFGITGGSILLAILVALPGRIGVYNFQNGAFFANTVILQYLPLIYASLLAGITLDIYLLWRGSWSTASRAALIGANFLSIATLALLYKGHTAWLVAHGSTVFLYSVNLLSDNLSTSFQIFGMEAFRMAFGVALVVTVVETIAKLVKMILKSIRTGRSPVYQEK